MKQQLLKKATNLFSYIDSDFENWDIDEGVKKTGVKLNAVKQEKDFTFQDVFTEDDCISQADVIAWVTENKEEILKTGHYYFFQLKNSKGVRFVARAFEYDGEVGLGVNRFVDTRVWRDGRGRVVVLPQTLKTPSKNTLKPLETLTLCPHCKKELKISVE